MRVSDLLKSKRNGKPLISFEFFPNRDAKSAEAFEKVMDELSVLNPDLVTVTFGAGGSTREGSYQMVNKLMHERGLNTVAYFAGYGLGPDDIIRVLDRYKALGVETIFVIRGDAPREDSEFKPHPQSFHHASELISFIKARYDFCLGAAGYPEGHLEAESKEKDLEYLKLKVDNGAEYIVTQYFYNNQYFLDFVERCHKIGINVPILPGIMPIYSVKMMETLANLCGATITDEVRQGLARLPADDKTAVARFGVEFAKQQCEELIQWGVPGLHFYTMNRSKSVVEIIASE